METIEWPDFERVEIRIGTIVAVDDFTEARVPAYKLTIDFGEEIGVKKSSSQITQNYSKEELVGKQVPCVVNFPPKQVGPFISEVLTTGVYKEDKTVVLLSPDQPVPNGAKLC